MWTETVLFGFLFLYLPALIVCGLFYLWGRKTRRATLGPTLRRSAVFWIVILFGCYTVVVAGLLLCQGDMLYGYTACRGLPTALANASFLLWFGGTAIALIYGVTLALFGAFAEWRNRRA